MTTALRPQNIVGDRISLQEIGTETLIYDERTHKAWCLNQSAGCIWRLCDGQNTVAQVAAKAAVELGSPISEDLVLVNLVELQQQHLLQEDSIPGLPEGISRREMISRSGLAAAALLPVIAALTAPPAAAQSGSVGTGAALARRSLQRILAGQSANRRNPFR